VTERPFPSHRGGSRARARCFAIGIAILAGQAATLDASAAHAALAERNATRSPRAVQVERVDPPAAAATPARPADDARGRAEISARRGDPHIDAHGNEQCGPGALGAIGLCLVQTIVADSPAFEPAAVRPPS
jgi:hypothetical protein